MKDPIFQALAEAARKGESISLGIVTGAKGSSPQKIGAKAIFHADRKIQGTLGGGCLEADIVANTQKFTSIIEEYVRKYPEQWLWVHRRWKTRPEGERGLY